MKTVKFRIWNGMEMVYDITSGKFGTFYVNPEKGDGLNPEDTASLTVNTTKYHEGTPLMQFTGLVDKNGSEIYEGDILKHNNDDLIQVCWGHHLWAFIPINRKKNRSYQDACFPNQFTVIGNIYQNSELLREAV